MSGISHPNLDKFAQSLLDIRPSMGSPRGYEESFSSTTSGNETDIEEPQQPVSPKVRRVVTDFDEANPFYQINVPYGSSEEKQDFFDEADLAYIKTTRPLQTQEEGQLDIPPLDNPDEAAPLAPKLEQSPYVQVQTDLQPSNLGGFQGAFAGSQFKQISELPEASSISSEEVIPPLKVNITPLKLSEARAQLTQKPALKRTYLDSKTLDSLVTSVSINVDNPEPSRKRPRYDFSDKSFACLFGIVTDPVTGEQRSEQQVFPRTLWPASHMKQAFTDHTLASMPSGDVHIVSIAPLSAFEIVTDKEQIFGTVLRSSKDSVDISINGKINRLTQLDSFILPPHSKVTILNQGPKLRAQMQLVAMRGQ